jgi:hypothetical protein
MRTSRPRVLALCSSLIVASGIGLAGCNHEGRGGHNPTGTSGPCTDGQHKCVGKAWNVCQGGVYTTQENCGGDQVCTDALGCTACVPGASACDGDKVVACDMTGHPSTVVTDDCSPLTCATDPVTGQAACVTPCDPKALAKSYTGCVYYAVDLPQFTIPTPITGVIAADQQFAVAVANPWKVAIDVTVERDDAAPGASAPTVTQVLKQQVAPESTQTLNLPQREVSGYVAGKRNRSLLTAAAYRVTTSRPASVYQFNPINNPDAFSNDASLLIPENALDESYIVLGWPGNGGDPGFGGLTIKTDKRSYVTIVATKANTKVRVTPSTEIMAGDNVSAMHKGMPYTFSLNQFETLNLEGADFATAGATDFSGTRIEADAPLAVWSGVECITLNPNPPMDPMKTCCCDHMEEQLFPRSSLGQDYVVVRSEGRSHATADPEFFRVLALQDNTTVHTTLPPPDHSFTLMAGQFHEVMSEDDFIVQADKAVMVGQYQTSQDASPAGEGDPSFSLVPPVAQHRAEYIFVIPTGYHENWLLMSIPSGTDVTIDGHPLSAQEIGGCDRMPAGPVGMTQYDALRCPVQPGSHVLTAPSAFGLLIEGWGPGPVSYAYTGGMEFQSVNHDCTSDGDCPGEFCSGGTCTPLIVIQ